MSNNINISSGSKSFQNKIFGRVTKLTKPSFAYEGKIFSDSTFNNQTIIPLLQNNIYYIDQGLPDELIVYNENYSINIETIFNQLSILSSTLVNNSPVGDRNSSAVANSLFGPSLGISSNSSNTYECELNNFGFGFSGCDIDTP
jgi:hypothetical protein